MTINAFVLALDKENSNENEKVQTDTDYINLVLNARNVNRKNARKDKESGDGGGLGSIFTNIEGVFLPYPIENTEDLYDLATIDRKDLLPSYVEKIASLRNHLSNAADYRDKARQILEEKTHLRFDEIKDGIVVNSDGTSEEVKDYLSEIESKENEMVDFARARTGQQILAHIENLIKIVNSKNFVDTIGELDRLEKQQQDDATQLVLSSTRERVELYITV